MLSLLDNALLQGLSYGIAVLGITISFRMLRYPDLTADGSFLLGSVTYVAGAHAGLPIAVAAGMACGIGVAAGAWTSILNSWLGVNRLLTGILTTMMAYSVAFRVLGGRPNVGLDQVESVFNLGSGWDNLELPRSLHVHPGSLTVSLGLAATASALVLILLRSEWGLMLRATGHNPRLIEELGRKPAAYQLLGLALANGLVAFGGAVTAARQGFADVNMGVGVVIILIAALVMGEGLVRLVGVRTKLALHSRLWAAFAGATAYFFLYVLVLHASISGWLPFSITPTDLKFFSALVVVTAVALKANSPHREETLPL